MAARGRKDSAGTRLGVGRWCAAARRAGAGGGGRAQARVLWVPGTRVCAGVTRLGQQTEEEGQGVRGSESPARFSHPHRFPPPPPPTWPPPAAAAEPGSPPGLTVAARRCLPGSPGLAAPSPRCALPPRCPTCSFPASWVRARGWVWPARRRRRRRRGGGASEREGREPVSV